MKAIVVCPNDVTSVSALAGRRPLALAPFLGQSALEYALAGLAADGYRQIQLVVADRPAAVREVVRGGEAWGLNVEVLPEMTTDDVCHLAASGGAQLITLNSLPQLPRQPLWRSYRDWHQAQKELLPLVAPQTVGMRELAPGAFVGLRSKVAPDAVLRGPCWIGAGVLICPGVSIGPGTIVGDGSYLDEDVELSGSVIGPMTYVGKFTEVIDSFAWGNQLLSFETGSLAELSDPFLLSEVTIRNGLAGGLLDVFRGGPDTASPERSARGSSLFFRNRSNPHPVI